MRERVTSVFRRLFVGQALRLPCSENDGKRRACPTIIRKTVALRAGSERGVALILTLGILVLLTLLVIAFAVSMRVENTASKTFNDFIKARELAQAGVDEAVGVIRMAAPPVSTLTNYVTAPGVIYTWSPNILTPTHWMTTPLFTWDPSNPNGKEVDLNTNNLITGISAAYVVGSSQLWVGWSNVVATVNGVNQLVGRYAYWVDDESAKVDLNVAGSRGADLQGYTPAGIDLVSLGFQPAEEVSLTNYVQTRSLDTIQSMVMTAPPLVGNAPSVSVNTFSNTQFYTTVSSTSPDITPWGLKRLNPSNYVANAASKVAAVNNIVTWLINNEDPNLPTWFGSGNNFTAKYPSLYQIAANIVDYITTDNTPTDNSTFNDTTPPTYLGLKETPYLNELVISNTFQVAAPTTPGGVYTLTINSYPLVELWYMYTNSLGWTPPNKPSVAILNSGASPLSFTVGGGFAPASLPIPATYTINNGITAMGPGAYQVAPPTAVSMLTQTATFNPGASPLPATIPVTLNAGTITAIFTSQQTGNKGRMDYAVIGLPQPIKINVPTGGNLFSALWAAQCNDPRVKPVSNTWKQNLGGPTLGAQNSAPTYNLSAGLGTIPGDGDTSCHVVSVNPNTTGGRQRGTMTPGEMAFIHTGIPWRTFWLQPQPSGEKGPPDWALLDLFSATDMTNVTGRMNINQIITNSVFTLDRLFPTSPYPLSALLTNSLLGTTYNQGTAALNIYNYGLLPRPLVDPLPANFSPYSYTMVGEVANTQGLSNNGGATKSLRETPVRDIANLVTPRSNTFTIWCLAQAVKKVDKTPANLGSFTTGADIVTGEAKVQAIVERTVDYSTAALPIGPQVRFRTLYYRYIYQ